MPKTKQEKPYPGFPLFFHSCGQWAKKVRGRHRYFGTDPEEALEKWLDQRDDLMAGREPRQRDDSLTVAECWTLYLEAAELRVANGDMRRNSWVDTRDTGQLVASRLGRHTPVRSLRVIDFEQLATWLRSRYALATVKGKDSEKGKGVIS